MAPIPSPVDSRVAAVSWNRGVIVDTTRPPDQAIVEELPLIRPGFYFYPASWSLDGKLLYGSDLEEKSGEPTATYSYDFATRTYKKLGPPDEQVFPLKDGRHLLYFYDEYLGVIDTADGSSRVVFDPSPDRVDSAGLSRDEKWLYLSIVSVDGDLWLAEPE